MNNPDLTPLALGIDLMTLGLNLNSSDNLYKKFSSPWSDESAKGEPHYAIPSVLIPNNHLPLIKIASRGFLQRLCFIFSIACLRTRPNCLLQTNCTVEDGFTTESCVYGSHGLQIRIL